MIQIQEVMKATVSLVSQAATDKLHRTFKGGFNGTDITFKCGYSGNDLTLKFYNIRGQVQLPVLAPVKKKIILPPGAKV